MNKYEGGKGLKDILRQHHILTDKKPSGTVAECTSAKSLEAAPG